MKRNRVAGLLDGAIDRPQPSLRGFMANPLAKSITPDQTAMYQAAYQQALEKLEEPEWPMAECWN